MEIGLLKFIQCFPTLEQVTMSTCCALLKVLSPSWDCIASAITSITHCFVISNFSHCCSCMPVSITLLLSCVVSMCISLSCSLEYSCLRFAFSLIILSSHWLVYSIFPVTILVKSVFCLSITSCILPISVVTSSFVR